MGLKIQYILHSTGTHHMYVITFCVLFVQERNRRLNVEVELTLQMATEAVQDMEQVSQGNCQLHVSMFYSDSNKLATKSVLMAIDAIIADLFDYGNM